MDSTNLPDGQITSDFQKLCQAPFAKIFLFAPDPNQFTDSHCLVPTRGAYRDRHERGAGCGGRGSARDERGLLAYGEVVWLFYFACEAAGALRARHSLRPLIIEGH